MHGLLHSTRPGRSEGKTGCPTVKSRSPPPDDSLEDSARACAAGRPALRARPRSREAVTQRPLPSRTVAGFLTSALVAAALTVAPAVGTSAAVTPAAAAPGTSQADHALRSPRTYRMAGAVARRTVVVGGKIRLRGGVVTKPGRGAAKPRPIRLTER